MINALFLGIEAKRAHLPRSLACPQGREKPTWLEPIISMVDSCEKRQGRK
jgi:hypothetical protein